MNIVAQAPALSVNNVFSNNYNIYPIPANDVLHIEGLNKFTVFCLFHFGKRVDECRGCQFNRPFEHFRSGTRSLFPEDFGKREF